MKLGFQARLVMSDVVEDFSTLNGVVSRFEEWKAEDPDSYGDAYVSICLPKIFSPIIRLNLLFWNPLTVRPYHLQKDPEQNLD